MKTIAIIILFIVPALRLGAELQKINYDEPKWSAKATAILLVQGFVYVLYYFAGLFNDL